MNIVYHNQGEEYFLNVETIEELRINQGYNVSHILVKLRKTQKT